MAGSSVSTAAEFESLFRRCRQVAYTLAYRIMGNATDAEDVVQDACLRAWANFDTYDATRPFEKWLYQIIKNRAIDLRIRQQRVPIYSLDSPLHEDEGNALYGVEFASEEPSPEEIVVSAMMADHLSREVDALPEKYGSILTLLAQDRTYEEIAAHVGHPIGTIRSRIYRARLRLQRTLGDGAG